MKKLILVITGVILIALTQFVGVSMADSRPNYPFNNPTEPAPDVPRHHIIPWKELVEFGNTYYNSTFKLMGFLNNYNQIATANLGSYQNNLNQLATDFVQQTTSESKDVMNSLFAWMQGNLVKGNRLNDPGEVFDIKAYNCREQVAPNVAYDNLQNRWQQVANYPESQVQVFNLLRTNALVNADGNPCWN